MPRVAHEPQHDNINALKVFKLKSINVVMLWLKLSSEILKMSSKKKILKKETALIRHSSKYRKVLL